MRLKWEDAAKVDRREIRAYVAQHNPRAALALSKLFLKEASRLTQYPYLGRVGRLANTREWVAHPNYILIYDVTPKAVRILRVLHAARQWP